MDGSFWSGRTFRSFQEVPKVTKGSAFERVTGAVAADGWQITSASKDMGLLTAIQSVAFGHGQTAPLNVLVKDRQSGGVRVEVTFQTNAGVNVGMDAVRTAFCKILEAAGGQP
jgi:hypothetical protein